MKRFDLVFEFVKDQDCFNEHFDGLGNNALCVVHFLGYWHIYEGLIQFYIYDVSLSAQKDHVTLMEHSIELFNSSPYWVLF